MLASASRAIEGSLPLGAKHRAATLYSVGSRSDPDHEATLRFDGEAPRWWAHSVGGLGAIARVGSPPPRIVRGALPRCTRPAPNDGFAGLSCRRAQDETLRDLAGIGHAPERDEELARERDDGTGLAHAVGDARAIPLHQRALRLEQQEAPGELDHGFAHPRIAGLGEPLLASLAAALVRRAGHAGVARDGALVAQGAIKNLMCERVRRLEAGPRDARQQPHHGRRALVGRLLPAPL